MKITLKKKLSSVFLSLAMFLSLSSTYSANASDKIETKTTEEFSLSGDNLPVSLKEIIKGDSNNDLSSVRDDDELYSITYQNEDGSKSSKIFDIPIKYVNKDGKTKYIDTSIVKKSKSLDDYEYQNAANDFVTEFSTDAQTGIRITKDQKKVSMSILNESKEDMNSTKLPPKNINDESISLDLITEKSDEIKNGVVTGSVNDQFVYPKAFGDKTSVKYTNTFRGIKQDIILDENPGINTFSFNLDTDSLIPILVENGKSIIIVEPNKDNNYENIDNDNIKFYIPSIYVYDSYILPEGMNSDTTENAYHHFTEDCYYELEKLDEGQYKLTLVISEEFLNDPRTVYPVTVDPTLSVMNTVSNIDDTYTTSATPSTNYYLSSYLRIGNNSVASDGNGSGLYYTYLRYYSLPTLPSGQVIDSAYLKLKLTPGQTTAKNAKISHIDSSWNGSQLTWTANNPSIGSTVDSNVSHNGCSYYNFTVTASINSWYNGVNANCGWRIAYSNTSDKDLTRLYSSDSGISSDIPNLTINYKSSTPTIPTRTIADGTYYIRNLNSGKYIDVFNNGTLNGTSIVQYSFNGAKNQRWKVKYESDGYYSLRPMHVSDQSKTIDMLSQTSANTNGTDAQIWTYSSTYQEQKFLIQYASGGGYQIGTKQSNGNKVLEVTNSSTIDGEVVQIWEYSTDRTNDNWDLVPLAKERYCFTATNFTGVAPYYNAPMSNAITPIQDNFDRMGYDVEYYQPLNAGTGPEFVNSLEDYKINVIHGHGYAGGVVFFNKNNSREDITVEMINALPNNSLNKVDLIAILSCHSADSATATLIHAVRNRGAKVAIGFKSNVTGAEFWFDNVTEELLKGESINSAIYTANSKTSNGFISYPIASQDDSPSNLSNQVILGSNQTLPLNPLNDPV